MSITFITLDDTIVFSDIERIKEDVDLLRIFILGSPFEVSMTSEELYERLESDEPTGLIGLSEISVPMFQSAFLSKHVPSEVLSTMAEHFEFPVISTPLATHMAMHCHDDQEIERLRPVFKYPVRIQGHDPSTLPDLLKFLDKAVEQGSTILSPAFISEWLLARGRILRQPNVVYPMQRLCKTVTRDVDSEELYYRGKICLYDDEDQSTFIGSLEEFSLEEKLRGTKLAQLCQTLADFAPFGQGVLFSTDLRLWVPSNDDTWYHRSAGIYMKSEIDFEFKGTGRIMVNHNDEFVLIRADA